MTALIGQVVYEPMQPPSQMAPHLGPRFDEWFARACNRDVDRRFTNAIEQMRHLGTALGVTNSAQSTGSIDRSLSAPSMSISSPSVRDSGSFSPDSMSLSAPPSS